MRWLQGMIVGVALTLAAGSGVSAAMAQAWSGTATLSEAADPKSKPQIFEGTVEWKTGVDAQGKATLLGNANFPTQGLAMNVVIAPNPDASVPASHLFDIRFDLGTAFTGQSVTDIPGLALKNDAGAQGTPLVGASVKAGDNGFLFALSAAPADLARNMALLGDRDYLDMGVVYGNGHRAVLTLGLGEARAAFADFAAKALK